MRFRSSAILLVAVFICCFNWSNAKPLPEGFRKGVDLFAFNSTVMNSPSFLDELKEIKTLGADWVAVNFMIVQTNETSSDVHESPTRTPTATALKDFIRRAHDLGLKVLLKPLVVCLEDKCTFFTISPSDPLAWFRSYGKYMQFLASFAEMTRVEALSVGLEFYHFSGATYTDYWLELIHNVRQQYSGHLTYCSIFWPVETQLVQFWSALDFIAMDTYVPFIKNATTDPNPTMNDMVAKFELYFSHLQDWHSSQPANVSSLPIILTEVGYTSCKNGMAQPAQDVPDGCGAGDAGSIYASNVTLQQMAYEALFTVLTTNQTNVIEGMVIFWFDNPSSSDWYPNRNSPSSTWGCGWTPRGKPAECTIADAFGGQSTTTKCS